MAKTAAAHSPPAHSPTADSQPHSPPPDDAPPGDAEAAFQRCQPQMTALGRADIVTAKVDTQAAAVVAIGVAQFITTPSVASRFDALGRTGEFDLAAVAQLDDVARATWFARHRYLLADATRTTAQLPLKVVEDGTALKGRMLKVVGYHLEDDLVAGPRIAAIRSGTGHLDLANDLHALGEMYLEYATRLRIDKSQYRETDGPAAKAMAADMLAQLGGGGVTEADRWAEWQSRAWTLLLRVYEEVRRGGLFLFHREDGDSRFPSLVTAVRRSPGSSTDQSNPAPTPAPSPVPPVTLVSSPAAPPSPPAVASTPVAE